MPSFLGRIVEFALTEQQFGQSILTIKKGNRITTYKYGNTKMVPPKMVVIEVIKEKSDTKKIYDESSGKKISQTIKLNCQWFSVITNKFHTKWFDKSLLTILTSLKFEKENFKINQAVSIKTLVAKNIQTESITQHQLINETDKTDYKLSRIFDNTTFAPPKMVITKISDNLSATPIYDKSTGLRKRWKSKRIIKCMWFDHMSGKFSEHEFMEDSLISITNIKEEPLLNQFELNK